MPTSEDATTRIIAVNGRWLLLQKFVLVLIPVIVTLLAPWFVWVTYETVASSIFRSQGERFTKVDAITAIQNAMQDAHDDAIRASSAAIIEHSAQVGHPIIVDRVESLDEDVDQIKVLADSNHDLLIAIGNKLEAMTKQLDDARGRDAE